MSSDTPRIKNVVKRSGEKQDYVEQKIYDRIKALTWGLNMEYVNINRLVKQANNEVNENITTEDIDRLVAESCAYRAVEHPDYSILGGRIMVSNLQKKTNDTFSEVARMMYEYVQPITNQPAPMVDEKVYAVIQKYKDMINDAIVPERDFMHDYFGFKTLERSYLPKCNDEIVCRPGYVYMLVGLGMYTNYEGETTMEDVKQAIQVYNDHTTGMYTHATPTLFNCGHPKPQCSSCFLLTVKEDSLDGIFNTLHQCAMISKGAGGIGLSIHKIRGTGSYIAGTNGKSNGLIPMLKVFNDTAEYVDQGGGKRKGSFAVYLEPWHIDFTDMLRMKKNGIDEKRQCKSLFTSSWIPDMLMRRVKNNEEWTLFCPSKAPGLSDVHSDEFDKLYLQYEEELDEKKNECKKVDAKKFYHEFCVSKVERGMPYSMFKDICNRKSNQSNLGTIRSSNLCTEVVQFTSKDEVAVCNLASIALPRFVVTRYEKPEFDHELLFKITSQIVRNLNRVIDINYYPIKEAEYSNKCNRPIGIGVQGLADTFHLLKLVFTGKEARQLNADIFETIYFAAMTESVNLAKKDGHYETFKGSKLSEGKFQFDLWTEEWNTFDPKQSIWDWESLRADVMKFGARNSLLVAPMPTASTSQILGNNECFEPYTSNLYSRRVLSGEFPVVNRHLIRELVEMDLWNNETAQILLRDQGSVNNIKGISKKFKARFKTVWEIPTKHIIDMAADRGIFICQSQSLNLYVKKSSPTLIRKLDMYIWEKGLKGSYYIRTRGAIRPIQYTVDIDSGIKSEVCRRKIVDGEVCISCGS
jgi:ribonucleoside-diphosphate reductase alpha chain